MKKTVIVILLGLLFAYAVGLGVQKYQTQIITLQSQIQQAEERLPSQADIQRRLVELGYDIEVDSVIGRQSRDAWDKATCNQYAAKWNWMYEDSK